MSASVDRVSIEGNAYLHTWTLTSSNAEGAPISLPGASDRAVTFVSADWSGVTAVLEGSNDGDAWMPLTDPQGNAISKTANALEQVMENPRHIRPNLSTPGTGKTVTVQLLSRSTMR